MNKVKMGLFVRKVRKNQCPNCDFYNPEEVENWCAVTDTKWWNKCRDKYDLKIESTLSLEELQGVGFYMKELNQNKCLFYRKKENK